MSPAEALRPPPGAFVVLARLEVMTRLMLLLAALTTAPLAAHAQASSTPNASAAPNVSAAFGNTVQIIDPDGRSRKIWLQPDGSWTGSSRRGLALAGKWTAKGDKVCLSQSKPRLFGSLCQTFPTDPDTELQAKDPSGTAVRVKLVKGHVES